MKKVLTVLGFIGFLALLAGFGLAQEEGVEVAKGLGAGLIAIGAGLAIGL
ncbi:MAG TPA: V-type ATP synthase subunit K, partial [Trueperaceae bacterium]|nr:V-type ATP synthase subunit K [Trueperaceae bacterium]